MARNLRVFSSVTDYNEAELVRPSVSYIIETDNLHYDDVLPPQAPKWVATYDDEEGSTASAECDASSAITENEITLTDLLLVEIGDCVTSIGDEAFYYCSSLISIDIPNSVTSIGDITFFGCSSLTSINIPSGVTSIGAAAFSWCSSLTSINIPNSVTSIGHDAFDSCESLTSVTVNATTPPTLEENVFSNTNDCPIYVPAASVDAYKSASGWSDYASRIQAIQ